MLPSLRSLSQSTHPGRLRHLWATTHAVKRPTVEWMSDVGVLLTTDRVETQPCETHTVLVFTETTATGVVECNECGVDIR